MRPRPARCSDARSRRCPRGGPRMASRPLRDEQYADDDEHREDRGGEWPAHVEAALGYGLVEEIADRGTEWTRQDERRPEEHHVGDARAVIGNGDEYEQRTEHERAAAVAESGVRDPIAERGAEGLGEGDGEPVERLDARCVDRVDRYRPLRAVPQGE